MSNLSFRAIAIPDLSFEYSHITDLEIYTVNGVDMLFATTRFDGTLTSWNISGNGITAQDERDYDGGLRAGGTGSLQQVSLDGTPSIITGGTVAMLDGLQNSNSFNISQGRQAVYGGLTGQDGIGRLLLDSAGQLVKTRYFADTNLSYTAAVSDGNGGHDKIWAASSNDRAYGNTGDDNVWGADGHDMLTSGYGNDRLFGSLHTVILNGGEGDDRLWGGLGRDQFIFREGHDNVQDFEQSVDRIGLDHDLWDGNLQPADVLFPYGAIDGEIATLDFQNGQVLTSKGVTDYAGLAEFIDLV